MSNRQIDLSALRRQLLNAETAIIDLNREITEAIVTKKPTGTRSAVLDEIIEARDTLRARLARFEAIERSGAARANTSS